jgi:Fic family protein
MILLQKYEPQLITDENHYRIFQRHTDLIKIYEFVELPEQLQQIEKQNSQILRNYYANALDHNLVDMKTVKYVLNGNLRPKGLSERAIEQYAKAEHWLHSQLDQPLQVSMLYQLHKLLTLDLYNNREDINLFSANKTRSPEKLSFDTEQQLEALFEFVNNDTEYHPVTLSWILHFRILNMQLFSEAQTKMALLLQNFLLRKRGMDLFGLFSIEHELYLSKNEYQTYFGEEANTDLQQQVEFGMQMYSNQLNRLKLLLRSYFRKQIDFDKHTPRLKNIMNYVFERGFKLKEIDDSVLNKRQKLIMYVIQQKGFIATKELIDEFGCNRKTIQRDFNALLELNLVKVVGQGAGLKYAVNIQETKYDFLQQYQTAYLQEENAA